MIIYIKIEKVMKFQYKTILFSVAALSIIAACHSNNSGNIHSADTSIKTPMDTTGQQMIPGTPGPGGTEPKPGDTTRVHNDSLKKARDLDDSTQSGK
jgi:hypothetical protein